MLYNKNQKHLQMLCNQSDRFERAEWVGIMGRQEGAWRFPNHAMPLASISKGLLWSHRLIYQWLKVIVVSW